MSKMTDEQIKKGLECCADLYDCTDCPCKEFCGDLGMLQQNALNLINRQQAEIEKQKRKKDVVIENYQNLCDKYVVAGADAIKEFAERLKEKAYRPNPYPYIEILTKEDIDNLVKEMVGEGK